MANTKQLKARLKSIKNTKKITKAMEMVAASKMKRAISAAVATREYSFTAWEILTNISEAYNASNPLLDIREVEKICLVLITPNKGLCGSLTSQLMKKVFYNMDNPYSMMINRAWGKRVLPKIDPKKVQIDIITLGKRGSEEILKHPRYQKNIIAKYDDLNEHSKLEEIAPIAELVMERYLNKECDKVIIAYTDFISTILHKSRLRQVFPVSRKDLEKQLEELGGKISEKAEMDEVKKELTRNLYTFEPGQDEVLRIILPKVVESQIYQSFLESQAAEFSARMITMKNASDTADDMIKDFNFKYNQARQAAITQELAEISSGMSALEG